MMKDLLMVTLCLSIVVTACAPSPEIVATAIAQTETALPTSTPLPPPTATFTFTPEPPTSTPTETPTSMPDLRVINSDPKEFVCTKQDLPIDGDYRELSPGQGVNIGANLVSHFTNEKVLERYAATGRNIMEEFLRNTRRIDGWWVAYEKKTAAYSGFTSIQCIAEKFQSIEGAQLAVRDYNEAEIFSYDKYLYTENTDPQIGDVSVEVSNTFYSGFIVYLIQFSYRNYRVTITGIGAATVDDLYSVGEQILIKLEAAPLGEP